MEYWKWCIAAAKRNFIYGTNFIEIFVKNFINKINDNEMYCLFNNNIKSSQMNFKYLAKMCNYYM